LLGVFAKKKMRILHVNGQSTGKTILRGLKPGTYTPAQLLQIIASDMEELKKLDIDMRCDLLEEMETVCWVMKTYKPVAPFSIPFALLSSSLKEEVLDPLPEDIKRYYIYGTHRKFISERMEALKLTRTEPVYDITYW
jgi:hypothetical protein